MYAAEYGDLLIKINFCVFKLGVLCIKNLAMS